VKVFREAGGYLDARHRFQEEFRQRFGPETRWLCVEARLSFGIGLLLFRRLKLPRARASTRCATRTLRICWPAACLFQPCLLAWVKIYAHIILGQDDEAAQRWEDFQRPNAPSLDRRCSMSFASDPGAKAWPLVVEDLVALTGIEPVFKP
jgi:hypothetical protein